MSAKRESREWRVQVAEVERFQKAYCLANEAAQILGRSRATLTRWEAEGRVTPVYGKRVTPGAGFSLYRRNEIEQLRNVVSSYSSTKQRQIKTPKEDTQTERENIV